MWKISGVGRQVSALFLAFILWAGSARASGTILMKRAMGCNEV